VQLVDTHAHICFDSYDEDRELVMQRAYEAGVTQLIHPCCSLEEYGTLEELSKQFNGSNVVDLYISVGVHPCEIKTWHEDSFDLMNELLETGLNRGSKIKAIGETGLDYYHCQDKEGQEQQRQIFQYQIDIALKHNLPLIVHTRDAWQDTLEILKNNFQSRSTEVNGTIHCFTGDYHYALEYMKLGFCLSWGGVLTYKKNEDFRSFAPNLDISKILLETDCPFLPPQSNRGKRNEPSYMTEVAQVLADCYKMSLEDLAKITTENAKRVFRI
jgi:TatD DNase family protein